ncbi:hypothetical protein K439DRAFT_1517097 [Ramaria rubella]|nr:hypothetical protein K439DRAFT_1517097 [Ramaria rubella]
MLGHVKDVPLDTPQQRIPNIVQTQCFTGIRCSHSVAYVEAASHRTLRCKPWTTVHGITFIATNTIVRQCSTKQERDTTVALIQAASSRYRCHKVVATAFQLSITNLSHATEACSQIYVRGLCPGLVQLWRDCRLETMQVGVDEGSLVRTRRHRVLTHYQQENSVNPSMPALQASLPISSITDGLYSCRDSCEEASGPLPTLENNSQKSSLTTGICADLLHCQCLTRLQNDSLESFIGDVGDDPRCGSCASISTPNLQTSGTPGMTGLDNRVNAKTLKSCHRGTTIGSCTGWLNPHGSTGAFLWLMIGSVMLSENDGTSIFVMGTTSCSLSDLYIYMIIPNHTGTSKPDPSVRFPRCTSELFTHCETGTFLRLLTRDLCLALAAEIANSEVTVFSWFIDTPSPFENKNTRKTNVLHSWYNHLFRWSRRLGYNVRVLTSYTQNCVSLLNLVQDETRDDSGVQMGIVRLLAMLAQDKALCSSGLHSTLLAPDDSTVRTGELDVSSDVPVDFVLDKTSKKLTSASTFCKRPRLFANDTCHKLSAFTLACELRTLSVAAAFFVRPSREFSRTGLNTGSSRGDTTLESNGDRNIGFTASSPLHCMKHKLFILGALELLDSDRPLTGPRKDFAPSVICSDSTGLRNPLADVHQSLEVHTAQDTNIE